MAVRLGEEMAMPLEELAAWLETQGTSQCFSGDVHKLRAAAASCRELAMKRSRPKPMSMTLPDELKTERATDAALKECE